MMRFVICGAALAVLVACGEDKSRQNAAEEAPPLAAEQQTDEIASLSPVRDDSFCRDWVSDAMLKEHCGKDVTLEPGFTRGNRCEWKAIAGDKVLFTASFIRTAPESWDRDQRHFPAQPAFQPHKQGEGGLLRFSVYPHLVTLASNNPTPPCDETQLRALGTAVAAEMPAAEEAPETARIPGCGELLPASEVESACGKAIAVKPTGMADGDLNVCSHSAGGLIFLLTRHHNPSTAQKAAAVVADGADVADGAVHVFAGNAGPRAVAPVRNLLVELKSSAGMDVPEPPCTAGQIQILAEGVVARLQ